MFCKKLLVEKGADLQVTVLQSTEVLSQMHGNEELLGLWEIIINGYENLDGTKGRAIDTTVRQNKPATENVMAMCASTEKRGQIQKQLE